MQVLKSNFLKVFLSVLPSQGTDSIYWKEICPIQICIFTMQLYVFNTIQYIYIYTMQLYVYNTIQFVYAQYNMYIYNTIFVYAIQFVYMQYKLYIYNSICRYTIRLICMQAICIYTSNLYIYKQFVYIQAICIYTSNLNLYNTIYIHTIQFNLCVFNANCVYAIQSVYTQCNLYV